MIEDTVIKLTVPTPTVVTLGSKYVSYWVLEPDPVFWNILNDLMENSVDPVPVTTLSKDAENCLENLDNYLKVLPTPAW